MKLYKYVDANGKFDYERYKRFQVQANHAKLDKNWVFKPTIKFLSNYLETKVGRVTAGICHGTRRGNEQAWFREYIPGANVIGTEISDTAVNFPNTIQHDFHEPLPEWVGKADFVYSNSWDHAYDPAKAFRVWIESLRPGGVVLLEHTQGHLPENAGSSDPFGVEFEELISYINESSLGSYKVVETVEQFDFEVPSWYGHLKFIVLSA